MPDRDAVVPEREPAGLSRRALIRAASGLAVAATLPAARASATVADRDWNDLRRRLRGALVRPGDPDYAAAKRVFFARFDSSTPAAVVRVATPADVQAAMDFARMHDLPVAARSGGHSFVGASASPGALVVDVRALDRLDIEGDEVTVGAGRTAFSALGDLAPAGLALPVGTCPSVGLAGLTLGGGIGTDVRRYGLSCDRLLAADLVLPSGEAVRVDAATPDLFWLLRGAGGSAGIVTSLTCRAIPAIAKDVVRVDFPGDAAARVLTGWARWMPAADPAVYARVAVEAAETLRCQVLLVAPAGAGAEAAADLAEAAGVAPATMERRTLRHLDAVLDIGGDKPGPASTRVAGSDVVAELTPELAALAVEVIAARFRSGATGVLLVEPLDGAVQTVAPDATVFPWRRHAAALEWIVKQPESPDEALAWMIGAHHLLGRCSTGANFNHVEPADTLARCFAGNLERLRALRRSVDPDHRLRWGLDA
ncbi:FAD-binding oxidoreductase [Nocardia sp. NPDC048505]|uniref:FAD-binding oxidoreductase n=1 Tax=unclassified Nocardia TaxID=2637762 RepID=UPI0033CE1281